MQILIIQFKVNLCTCNLTERKVEELGYIQNIFFPRTKFKLFKPKLFFFQSGIIICKMF